MPTTHTLVSAIADGADTALVRPSDWNADHTVTGVVTGSGTTNTIAKFTSSTAVGNSLLTDDGTNVVLSSGQVRLPNGTAASPSLAFSAETGMGFYRAGQNDLVLPMGGTPQYEWWGGGYQLGSGIFIGWSSISNATSAPDVVIRRDAAAVLAQRNGTNAQEFRLYNTFTDASNYERGVFRWTSNVLELGFQAAGTGTSRSLRLAAVTGALQLRTSQTTAPTCTTNCGTSPSVSGTDTVGRVTMGATGTPASGWIVTFNGTWAAAPHCTVWSSLSGMAAGKAPIVVVTATTTFTVTTNGTSPANSDTYDYHCMLGS